MAEKLYCARPQDGPVWVTGASSGIGRELALALAGQGWTVAATARSADRLAEMRDLASSLPGSVHVFAGDVTDTRAMADICNAIEASLGTPALVVANAGIYLPQDGLEGDAQAFRQSFDVNLMGTVNAVLPSIAAMKCRGRGQIAIVSSVAGYRGLPTSAAYGATKAGLINLAESLKFDLDRAGLRLQVINPGFVDTPATKSNPFPMPHLMQVEEAVRHIVDGLGHPKQFEIAFPGKFVRQLKLLRILPYWLYFRIVARATGWNRKPAS